MDFKHLADDKVHLILVVGDLEPVSSNDGVNGLASRENLMYVAPGCITSNARRLYRAVGLTWNPKPWKLPVPGEATQK